MKIILDNGHGNNTKGKFSPLLPDGTRFYEYQFNREVVKHIAQGLTELGQDFRVLVPELEDIPLRERVKRANAIAREVGAANCLLISVHSNAAGGAGKWMSGKGVCTFYDDQTSQNNINRAKIFTREIVAATEGGLSAYKAADALPDTAFGPGYTILSDTICPALLTENGFYDNLEECRWLLKPENQIKVAKGHIQAILMVQ